MTDSSKLLAEAAEKDDAEKAGQETKLDDLDDTEITRGPGAETKE